jgi:hypothetical protein
MIPLIAVALLVAAIVVAPVQPTSEPSPAVVPQPTLGPDAPTAAQKWTATYCKPTPKYCRSWGGDAHLAAVRSFKWGNEPYWVRVSRVADGQVRTTTVLVVSYCDCGSHNIDLSIAAYRELDPTEHGRITVSVTRIDGVPTRLPNTDTEVAP